MRIVLSLALGLASIGCDRDALLDGNGDLEVLADAAGATDGAVKDGGSSDAAGACVGSIMLSVDGGPLERLGSICDGDWGSAQSTTAVGYVSSGGPHGFAPQLMMDGCVSAAVKSEGIGIRIAMPRGPGMYTMGGVGYTDSQGMVWSSYGVFFVTLSQFDAVGGVIEGTLNAEIQPSGGGDPARQLHGTFHVCRVPDQIAQ